MTEQKRKIRIHPSWLNPLISEFQAPYMLQLRNFLEEEAKNNKIIYPPMSEVFSAFNLTHFEDVKVVIIGQDPYHGPNQAHGLCFSVLPPTPPPPSLVNIYKELQSDLGITPADHGLLIPWAEQGVFMINAILTVEKGNPLSHKGKGWEQFTDKVIDILNKEKENLVFLLWGSPAQQKAAKVDTQKHLVLKAPHPSPLAAHRGFFGCEHFSKCNEYLKAHGKEEIDWKLPSLNSLKKS